MPGEALRIQRCRGDDELEVGPARQQLLEIAEQKVDVERALVRLVDDQGVVIFQQRIAVDFRQQNAVGHQLDAGVGRHLVVEAHLVADCAAEFGFQLRGNARRHRSRRHAARLGVADAANARRARASGRFSAIAWSCRNRSRRTR